MVLAIVFLGKAIARYPLPKDKSFNHLQSLGVNPQCQSQAGSTRGEFNN
ncbi:hypothetical protein [Moorena bouillonii]|nr:hypothetical protein [Moorena bouillonii]